MARKKKQQPEEQELNAARIVAAAIIGEDFKVVLVGGKRHIVQPPTIKKLAGAAFHLQEIGDTTQVGDLLTSPEQLMSAAHALSWLINGNDELAEELAEGTPQELAEALSAGYSLVDTHPFSTLLVLSKNVGKLTATSKQ